MAGPLTRIVRGPAAILALALAFSACGGTSHVGPSPSPFGSIPEIQPVHSHHGAGRALVKAMAGAVHLKPRDVRVISAVTSGDQAVALIGYRANGKQTNRVVAFGYRTIKRKRNGKKLSEKRWVAEDATTDLWPDRSKRGSRAYPVGSVAAGDMIGVGGYIDPGITRVEADGPGIIGDVTFGDPTTFQYAASLPMQTLTFTKAIFSQVANALGYFTGLALYNPGTSAASVGLGNTFTALVLSPRWQQAADLVADGVSPRGLLPPLHRFLGARPARVVGRGTKTKTGATFVVQSGPLRWRLTLITEAHGGSLKVRQYTLDRLAP